MTAALRPTLESALCVALGPMGQGRQDSPAARGWHLCSGPSVSAQVLEAVQGDCALCEHVDVVDQVVLEGERMVACTFRPRGRAEHGRSPRRPVRAWHSVWATSSFWDPEGALSPTWRSASACCSSDTVCS